MSNRSKAMHHLWSAAILAAALISASSPQLAFGQTSNRIKTLLVDGQNNHAVWPKTSEMMRKYLIDSGLFQVELARTAPNGVDDSFRPDFSSVQLVVSNYNGSDWPEATQKSFELFVENGGGLVVIHAADNAFPNWDAWNRMIGLGGWGGRDARSGPYVYFDVDKREFARNDEAGNGGSHGSQHAFVVETRNESHPIMKGIPARWLHVQDELYDRLRGPAEKMEVLATAHADPKQGGSGRHEPMVMVVEYGKGRVFHTTLGHGDYSQECVGFITLFLRGSEWAATGKVTQALPADFPTEEKTASRPFKSDSQK